MGCADKHTGTVLALDPTWTREEGACRSTGLIGATQAPWFLQKAVLVLPCNSLPPPGADVLGSILSSPQAQEGGKSTPSCAPVCLFVMTTKKIDDTIVLLLLFT